MNIGERIKLRRKELGLTQEQLARMVNVSQAAIHKLEEGRTRQPRNILDLASALKCQPEWLLHGGDEPVILPVTPISAPIGLYPIISWEQASQWPNISTNQLSLLEHLPCGVQCSEQAFILEVQGISMEPIFQEGEMIYVDPQVEPKSGKYVVAQPNKTSDVTFKQLFIEGSNKYLKSANPNWPEQITHLDASSRIIGTVIFSGRRY
ncbi:helix-turn-helix domain-containing protein [Endozoicomonas sp. SM1973]|uniref:Helix-turn-helix domain-containing protein n=1 Tax=Spartinivicinus marinus TaxID=2994442 RepID=A0A853IEK8_9GAMM|nr:S24 family peptidase [Spartinivicinus marinus]MCX4025078.1 helix-turn-helix domain-containing protein [Spartinivicinus marinus]NYZ68968.1 helix-turn-helix domain-containing protein [Spartinivicinus marinus]